MMIHCISQMASMRAEHFLFFSNFALTLTKALPQRKFFYIVAFILAKTLPKGCFLYFCSFSNQTLPQRVFLYFCVNPNQSPTTKGVFPYFFPYFNLNHTKNGVYPILALTLNKPLPQGCFFSTFALFLN